MASTALLAVLMLAGCSSIGPGTVKRDRIDYIGAVADSWKHQTLLNIVRIRYADAPVFLDVASLISSYTLQTQVTLSGEIITDETGSFFNPTASALYEDKPTISYTPLTGDKFAKALLRPITPTAIFSLIQAGYPADFVLRSTVRAINSIYNRSAEGAVLRPADPDFYPLLAALRRIQQAGALGLRFEKREPDEVTLVSFPRQVGPDLQRDIDFAFRVMKLKPNDKGELLLSFGATQSAPNDIALLSRSMFEILIEIAAGIDVPPDDVAQGRTAPSPESSRATSEEDRPMVPIHAGPTRPANAYFAVHYRDSWYWIDDRDFTAKRGFTFLMLFFSLAETGAAYTGPVLTVPTR